MQPSTIGSINMLDQGSKEVIYSRLIPSELLTRFNIPPTYKDKTGNVLIQLDCPPGKTDVELRLFHQSGFPDPILYGHLTDTVTGQIHVLLYILNDPNAPRFEVDCMPDGQPTRFGIIQRNLPAEEEALNAGLAPGQVRAGLRLLSQAIKKFEEFVTSLGHKIYFVEPLYYHNAVLFERYGFSYQVGKKLMERIESGFATSGDLRYRLDNSTPFRSQLAEHSIRLRSWAIHDGLLGEPFTNVTMFKHVGKSAGINTCPSCAW